MSVVIAQQESEYHIQTILESINSFTSRSNQPRKQVQYADSAYRTLKVVFHDFTAPFMCVFQDFLGPLMSIPMSFQDCLIL